MAYEISFLSFGLVSLRFPSPGSLRSPRMIETFMNDPHFGWASEEISIPIIINIFYSEKSLIFISFSIIILWRRSLLSFSLWVTAGRNDHHFLLHHIVGGRVGAPPVGEERRRKWWSSLPSNHTQAQRAEGVCPSGLAEWSERSEHRLTNVKRSRTERRGTSLTRERDSIGSIIICCDRSGQTGMVNSLHITRSRFTSAHSYYSCLLIVDNKFLIPSIPFTTSFLSAHCKGYVMLTSLHFTFGSRSGRFTWLNRSGRRWGRVEWSERWKRRTRDPSVGSPHLIPYGPSGEPSSLHSFLGTLTFFSGYIKGFLSHLLGDSG